LEESEVWDDRSEFEDHTEAVDAEAEEAIEEL
jgi:hypothetical protein